LARSEHTVTYDAGHKRVEVTRIVFDGSGGRILGTQLVKTNAYRGYDGWKWVQTESTYAFGHANEAAAWMDAMFREHQTWLVQGGSIPVEHPAVA